MPFDMTGRHRQQYVLFYSLLTSSLSLAARLLTAKAVGQNNTLNNHSLCAAWLPVLLLAVLSQNTVLRVGRTRVVMLLLLLLFLLPCRLPLLLLLSKVRPLTKVLFLTSHSLAWPPYENLYRRILILISIFKRT